MQEIQVLEDRTLLAAWVAEGPGPATNGQVENVSPNNEVIGAIHTVLAHPTDPDVLYVGGTNGGIWKTENATAASPNWTPLTDDQQSLSIGAMTFDVADTTHETIWAGIGRYSSFGRFGGDRTGLLKSTDGGDSWNAVDGGGTLVGKNISGIVVDGNEIVVSVNVADSFSTNDSGIFRSTNGGTTFTRVSTGDGSATGLPGGIAFDLVRDPANPDTLYTSITSVSSGGDNGIYKSTNFGASWSKVSNSTIDGQLTFGVSNVEFAHGPTNVFVGIVRFGNPSGFFRSDNAGTSWVQLDTPETNENGTDVGLNPRGGKGPQEEDNPSAAELAGGQGNIHFSIVADPNNGNIVYVGGDRQPRSNGDTGPFPNSIGATDFTGRLFRGDASAPAGTQWVHLTHSNTQGEAGGGTLSSSAPHADSREMVFDANGDIIEVDDGGVYRRTDPKSNTGDWFSVNGDLQMTEAHDVAYDTLNNRIVTGNQDTGTTLQTADGSSTFFSVSTADGGDVVFDNSEPNQVLLYSSFQNLAVFLRRTYDSTGALTSTVQPQLNVVSGDAFAPLFDTPVILNQSNSDRLLFLGGNGIYESTDQGDNLTQLTTTTDISSRFFLDAAYGGGGVENGFYVGNSSGEVLVRGAGSTITTTTAGDSLILDTAIDDSDFAHAFVIDENQVFETTNTGSTWTDITGNLLSTFGIDRLFTLQFVEDAVFGDALIVGTERGVYKSVAGSFDVWEKLGTGIPNAPVVDMLYDVADDLLIVSTMGRGTWSLASPLRDVTSPTVESFLRETPTQALTNFDSLVFRATFDEAVVDVDTADFVVDGTTTATVTNVSMVSSSVYDVTVSGGDLADFSGTVGLDLASTTDITDTAGNGILVAEPATDEQYALEQFVFVDNGDPTYFEGGSWFDSLLAGNEGSSSRYSQTNGASVRWNVENFDAGWYRVELFNIQHQLNTTSARIETRYAGQTAVTTFNPLTTPTGYLTVGTFYFTGDGQEYVRLVNLVNDTTLRADAVRLRPVAPPPTRTVDNGDPDYFEGGSWSDSSLTGSNGSSTRFSLANGASVRWNASEFATGFYSVELYNVASGQNTTAARIEVSHAGELTSRTLNLRTAVNGFLTIGTFFFDGRDLEYVRMVNTVNGTTLRADAVRFVPVPPPTERLVDNGDPDYFEGRVWSDSGLTGSNGSSTRFSLENGASVRWNASRFAPGFYSVELYNVASGQNTTAARIEVSHAGELTSRTRNLRTAVNGFLTIGTFFFDGRDLEYVRMVNTANGTTLRADAVRFVPVPPPTERVVDNGDPDHFEGRVWSDSGLTGSNGSSTRFSLENGASVRWNASRFAPGFYSVELYNVASGQNTTAARIEVSHAGELTSKTLNLRTAVNGFLTIGTFFFDGRDLEYVRMVNTVNGTTLRADAVRFVPVTPRTDGLVDNGDPDYFEGGTWSTSGLTGSNGSSTRFSLANGASVRWNASEFAPGFYSVELYNVASGQNTTAARIEVSHAGGLAVTTRNLRTAANGFLSIGTFFFDGRDLEYVRMVNTANGTTLRADAVRYLPVPPPPERLVDNGDPEYFEGGTTWADSGLTGSNGSTTRFATPMNNDGDGDDGGGDGDGDGGLGELLPGESGTPASVRWNFSNLVAGWYSVEFYNVAHPSNTTGARLEVRHAGVVSPTTLNTRTTQSGFVNVGRFFFDGRSFEFVRLENVAGDGVLRADAVRLRPTPPPKNSGLAGFLPTPLVTLDPAPTAPTEETELTPLATVDLVFGRTLAHDPRTDDRLEPVGDVHRWFVEPTVSATEFVANPPTRLDPFTAPPVALVRRDEADGDDSPVGTLEILADKQLLEDLLHG